jgi:preprotein translocase subunit Sss1
MIASVTGPEILVPLSFFALVGFIVYLNMRRKERESMIRNGINPDSTGFFYDTNNTGSNHEKKHPSNHGFTEHYKNVKTGLVLIGVGLGFFISKILIYNEIFEDNFSSYFSLVSLFGGLGLVGSYFFVQKLQKTESHNLEENKESGEKKL